MNQDQRARILAAAKERFGRFGFKKTLVDEIAEDVGMSKRTLYEMFGSKEKILAAVVHTEALSFRRYCVEQMGRVDDPATKLEMLLRLSKRYFDDNPFFETVLGDDEGFYGPFMKDEIEFVENGITRLLAGVLANGQQAGVFRPMDVEATAACILVLFRGFTYGRRPRVARTVPLLVAARGDERPGSDDEEWVTFVLHACKAVAMP